MKTKDMELIAVVARTLWLRRNGVVHGRIFSHPIILVSKAFDSLEAYCSANSCQGTRLDVIPITNLSWQGLLEGFVKVNWMRLWTKKTKKWVLEQLFEISRVRSWLPC
jgi:hypothetical protein